MSRICGIIDPSRQPDQLASDLDRLLTPMRHSSDFAVESCVVSPAAFGRVYFTQYNFSAHAAQLPPHNATCFFLGYLRDFPELAEQLRAESHGEIRAVNPAEVIAYLMMRDGPSCLAHLSGSYVFALWTARDNTLRIATDRWGMSTLYYRQSGNRFSFASEIKALLNLEPERGIDLASVQELFAIGGPVGDHTVYPSIFRLPPATILTFRDGKLSLDRYWWYDQVKSGGPGDLNEFISEMRRRLGRSVSKLLAQIEKPICLLSSGYDSRRIILEMTAQNRTPAAYTASIAQPTGRFEIDTLTSGALCRELGVPHVTSDLAVPSDYARMIRQTYALTDFETDAHAWILPLLPKIPVASGVNFDGTGGDVLEDGNFTRVEQAAHIDDPAWLAGSVIERFPDLWSSHFSTPPPGPSLSARIAHQIGQLPRFDHRFTIFYFMNWTRRKTSLFSQRLISLKCDSVYPFLDYDFVDLLLSVSPLWKRENKIRAAFLSHANLDLQSRLPSSHIEDIFLQPDPKWQSFCRAVPPEYWTQVRSSLYRMSSQDVVRSPRMISRISRQARLAAGAFALPGPSEVAPQWLTGRAWPLRLIGLYALQRRSAANQKVGDQLRDEAHSYIYSRDIASRVVRSVPTR